MKKIDKNFITHSFDEAKETYRDATLNIGLWKSERYVVEKYFQKNQNILDIGCGAGRTTINLFKMGYQNIVGLDLTPSMLQEAILLSDKEGLDIRFIEGDATDLNFPDNHFHNALFSFNGFMQIPGRKSRFKALQEIKRILKSDGIFVFTSHERGREPEYQEFWKEQNKIWQEGNQDKRLYDFGDIIFRTPEIDREGFINIPSREEIVDLISESGLTLVEDFYRSDLFEEDRETKVFSTECRFWVVKK